MNSPSPSDPRSDRRILHTLTFQLLVAVNHITRPFPDLFGQRLDLKLAEWRCLMALAAEPESSGEDVSRLMGMDKMTVSRSLRRQEQLGRVEKSADPTNRRRNRWVLTEAGWAVFDAIMPSALSRDRAAFGDLDDTDRAVIERVLSRFIAARTDPDRHQDGR